LSYTEFEYGKLEVTTNRIPANRSVTVTVEVKNTGERAGDEILQLYVHPVKSSVPWPPKELRGFERVSLKPGETKTVSLALPAGQLAFYDVKTHGFVVEPGAFDIMVGSSSRDIRGKLRLDVVAADK
jgi:beta-glucosidase